ncbi:hypothetical protein H4219_004249 [Mycoemilia scoparia]|uniref:Uncharacterized protein n=1 Tax=Mycoemilia scoparia TaxID=417184 RepID=A0A9W7ZSA7_9FUNG|nr:hypothetical protein H4219_004249 [Mycoemilia scoparia]
MGAKVSKQDEPVVFYGNQIKEGLANEITGKSEKPKANYTIYDNPNPFANEKPSHHDQQQQQQQQPTPPNTGATTRSPNQSPSNFADEVEAQVAKELSRYHEKLQIEEAKDNERYNHQYSTLEIRDSLRDMIQTYSNIPKKLESPVVKAALQARDEVAACYKNNPERTLDCWKQVQDFKEKVRAVEKEFISSAN